MEKLLQWAVKNTDTNQNENAETATNSNVDTSHLNTEVLDYILGKDEATMMKENMQVILDESQTLENRIIAFDNLEQLVESIDNAANLEPLKLWPSLINLLNSKEKEIVRYAGWVIGTATQNNFKAQTDFLSHDGLEALLKVLGEKTDTLTLKKLSYCLSCSIRHHKVALEKFQDLSGLSILISKLRDTTIDVDVKGRVLFMFNALINDEPSLVSRLHKHNFFNWLTTSIIQQKDVNPLPLDYLEKALQILISVHQQLDTVISLEEKEAFISQLPDLKTKVGENNISEQDWANLKF